VNYLQYVFIMDQVVTVYTSVCSSVFILTWKFLSYR